jgi:flagellar hook-associated protein 3 FlgL
MANTITRLTNNALNRDVLQNLQTLTSKRYSLVKAQATGQSVHSISEAPASITQAVEYHSEKRNLIQMNRNCVRVDAFLNISHQTLKSVYGLVERAQELAAYSSSEVNKNNIFAYAQEMEGLVNQLALQLNQRYVSKYLFSASKAYEAPFLMTKDDKGKITEVAYTGGKENPADIYVATDTKENGFLEAEKTQKLLDLMQHMIDLRDSLNDENIDNIKNIQKALNLDEHTLNQSMSSLAARMQKMKIINSNNTNEFSSAERNLSNLLDVDLFTTAAAIKNIEHTQEMSLKVSSMLLSKTNSLMDYIF